MLTLKEIQQIELALLKNFKSFCELNDIGYFLSNGTLLGAVKYGGFIPWDDDIDVFVPRKDYNRLIETFEDTEKCKLFSWERDKNYRFPFAKLCDMQTMKKEGKINNGVTLGVDIDIFPLDAWPDDKLAIEAKLNRINRLMTWLDFAKLRYNKGRTPIHTCAKAVCITMARCIGARHFIEKIQAEATEFSDRNPTKFLGCVAWPIYGKKEVIPAEVFSGKTDITFEGENFPAPVGFDLYLRSLYGDYEKDPPAEAQKTHHNFKAYRL